MRSRIHFFAIIIVSSLVTTALLFTSPKQPDTLPLVPMMQQLLADIQQVDRGIYMEDYPIVEDGAEQISDHPVMTPEDKEMIKSTLGTDMQDFVKYDMIVHHHADSIRMAATRENMKEILHHYRIVQEGCVNCHSNFREQISSARLERDE